MSFVFGEPVVIVAEGEVGVKRLPAPRPSGVTRLAPGGEWVRHPKQAAARNILEANNNNKGEHHE